MGNSLKQTIFFSESSVNLGGQEFQLLQQAKSLQDEGYECIIFCKPNSKIRIEALNLNIIVECINFHNAIDFKSIFLLSRFVLKHKPLGLVTHSGHDAVVGGLSGLFCRLFNFKLRVIRMKTYQAGIPSAFPYNFLFEKTFTPSEFLRLRLLSNKKILPNKVSVLYPGIDFDCLNNFTSLPLNLLNWLSTHPGPILAHGAMLRGEKGHNIILKALPDILKTFPDVRYVIAGEGPELNALKKNVSDNNLSEHVFFAGLIQPISSLLKISTLAIMPSLMEPLGMFQIESQYLRVPTLASNVDGIPETLLHRETGLLVESADVEEWARQICWALNNLDSMREWAENGNAFVQKKFSKNNNIENLLNILNINH